MRGREFFFGKHFVSTNIVWEDVSETPASASGEYFLRANDLFCRQECVTNDIVYLHRLEQETGVFFCMPYCEDLVMTGRYDDFEAYLNGFTKLSDGNRWTFKTIFEIRKQKYLEALDR